MSEPIKVGDLVMVVGAHCAAFAAQANGVIFLVDQMPYRQGLCACGATVPALTVARGKASGGGYWNIPPQYLKRIPPLEELDNVREQEELRA